MWRSKSAAAVASALIAAVALPALAGFDADTAMRASQQALGHEVRDLTLVASSGAQLRLYELRGKPVVISMIYTSCVSICPTTTRQLAAAVRLARSALGPAGFTVLSVGFDTAHDTPLALATFAAAQRISDPRWLFVSASREDLERLAVDTGFWFESNAGGWDHLIQTTLLDARGRVIRQLYGSDFAGAQLGDPLRKAALGAPLGPAPVASFIDRIRLLCTVYDARLGRYRMDYSLIISSLIALTSLVTVLVLVTKAWREGRSRGAS